jgi:signal transduction histidine kinase
LNQKREARGERVLAASRPARSGGRPWLSPGFDLVLGAMLLATFAGLRPVDIPFHAIFAVLVIRGFAIDLWGTMTRLAAIVAALASFVVIGAVGDGVNATDLAEWLLLIALVPTIAILAERRDQSTRRELAQDLHDGVGQGLGALMLTLDLLGRRVPGDDGTVSLVERARRLAETVLGEVEGVAFKLQSAVVHENGLAGAIQTLAADAGIPVDLAIDPEANVNELAPAAQTALFRIVQEALGNVARHSRATTARVAIEPAGGGLRVSIADDGVGFVPTALSRRGLGLSGMQERAERARGRLDISSRRDIGTVVSLVLPRTEVGLRGDASPRFAGKPGPVARRGARP